MTKPTTPEVENTVAIITIGTIVPDKPELINKDRESKEQLAKHIKAGFKILCATPCSAGEIATITYVLKKGRNAK